ncbi:MAG: hypothetical protein AB1489_35425 [Acidobacteriota bacterium]
MLNQEQPTKIQEGMCVVVHLHSPREKIWGILADISMAGLQVRGIDLNTFDDWIRMITRNERNIGLTYVFLPMWRIERMSLDETIGDIISLEDQFNLRVGVTLQEYLGTGDPIS